MGILGPLLAYYWLGRGAKCGCSRQCRCCNAGEDFLPCWSLNFSNACSAVTSEPPAKHQHCAHQCKWLPSLAELYIYRAHPHLSASAQKIQNTLWDSGDLRFEFYSRIRVGFVFAFAERRRLRRRDWSDEWNQKGAIGGEEN